MRSFLGIPFSPWIGQPSARPLAMCGTVAAAVPITIMWSVYSVGNNVPNFAVTIGMNTGGQRTLIDEIKSIFVDNLGVNVPVYVHFPSTGFVVVAKPNSACWYPVFTNDQVAVVVGEGFTDADANAVTNIFFANVLMQPYVDEEISQGVMLGRASTDISRGGNFSNSFYGAAALGDQSQQSSVGLSGANSAPAFRPGPGPGGRQLSGFYYLTNLWMYVISSSGAGVGEALLRNTDDNITIFDGRFNSPTNNVTIIDHGGFCEKLDATKLWELVYPGSPGLTAGALSMFLRYTYQQS